MDKVMKIAYCGEVLKEGLLKFGAKLYPFNLDKNLTFSECVQSVFEDDNEKPDLVITEFFAYIQLPKEIAQIPYPTIAFAFDSTINLHLYRHILKHFDYAFVDQKSSVQLLQDEQVNAYWLPFCVNESDFREHSNNEQFEFSFVGRITEFRTKRKNLISYLQQYTNLQLFSDISFAQMQDVFANSIITLNENLFNGLSLRVFQALAAGTILLTEENMDGTSDYFEDDKHLVLYNSSNILDKIKQIQNEAQKYREIALAGQNLCKEFHTSFARVQTIMKCILGASNAPKLLEDFTTIQLEQLYGKLRVRLNKRLRENNSSVLLFHELYYTYNYYSSFGGTFTHISKELEKLALRNDNIRPYINTLQGDISARALHFDAAEQYYLSGIKAFLEVESLIKYTSKHLNIFIKLHCKLIQVSILKKEYELAILRYENLNKFLETRLPYVFEEAYEINSLKDNDVNEVKVQLHYFIAQIYKELKEEVEIGFNKLYDENMPNTAIELAFTAWKNSNNQKILDFFLSITEKYYVTGEYLHDLTTALVNNQLSEKQKEIVYYANKNYYTTH